MGTNRGTSHTHCTWNCGKWSVKLAITRFNAHNRQTITSHRDPRGWQWLCFGSRCRRLWPYCNWQLSIRIVASSRASCLGMQNGHSCNFGMCYLADTGFRYHTSGRAIDIRPPPTHNPMSAEDFFEAVSDSDEGRGKEHLYFSTNIEDEPALYVCAPL